MGADFIGYILVGPETLKPTAAKRKALLKKADALVRRCQAAETADDYEGLEGVQDEYEAQYVAGLEPEKVLKEFLALWNDGSARDLNWRTAKVGGKTIRILSAGDMSWGDEPEGYAYQTMKAALSLNLCIPLGVE